MEQQIHHSKFTLCAIKGIQQLENCVSQSALERSLLELVKLRASQINDCDQCKELYTGDARVSGQTLERLFTLKNWREVTCFNDRERAALKWTEAIASSSPKIAVDALYDEVRQHFGEQELVVLTMAVNVIDSWNRLSLAVRTPVELSSISDKSNLEIKDQ